ncbi:Protein FAM151A [Seminavis robusta]|uniref:Protein FAM151A n=1 Tax=Seminavis robusta TaxID=568900 RepID=A0A9N8D859_9STRA|nr:Protein FAM151A [Seminavis robusta]|eukprot:Sro12_g009450.1 Protein FAM151A (325) ;mRNA; r:130123-131097
MELDYQAETERVKMTTISSDTNHSRTLLPSPQQAWVHAVDSRRSLMAALQDDTITAIETDLLMGRCTIESQSTIRRGVDSVQQQHQQDIPIMAHPPNTESDLSMLDFLQMVSRSNPQDQTGNDDNNTITKVIKLDFKQMETVEPTLKALVDNDANNNKFKTTDASAILLNADILPGPGRRQPGIVTMHASTFLETCIQYITTQQQPSVRFAFSLGFKTDFTDTTGYTTEDVQAMTDIIRQYKLVDRWGVVLALNARLLEKSLSNFDSILEAFPSLQILVWTGKGEPPIPQSLLVIIQNYYQDDMSHRIGYDCQVRDGEGLSGGR